MERQATHTGECLVRLPKTAAHPAAAREPQARAHGVGLECFRTAHIVERLAAHTLERLAAKTAGNLSEALVGCSLVGRLRRLPVARRRQHPT